MKTLLYIFPILMSLIITTPASAHRMNVYAWLENDQILVECSFAGKRPCVQSPITVQDEITGQKLLEGQMDAQGRFNFPLSSVIRQEHGLTIIVNGGQGHRGEWTMTATELNSTASASPEINTAKLNVIKQPLPEKNSTYKQEPLQNITTLVTREQIQADINIALERHIAPLRQQLAEIKASGPKLADIIGGLGWIIGLVGIGMYFKSRKV